MDGGNALDQVQIQVAKRQPSTVSENMRGFTFWSPIHLCEAEPVKIWPIDLLHANDVGVEVEASANVAHHDGDMICLHWI